MSFFYLSPVKGELPVHLLEIILDSRLRHLKKIYNGEPVAYNEYVVEGSIYDSVGHFTLCIITILSKHREFLQFFLKAEVEQFKLRLASLTACEMRCFSKRLLKAIKKYGNVQIFIGLQTLCRHLMLKYVSQHVCSTCCTRSCTTHSFCIKFTHCLPLVGRRQVELKQGNAIIPCGNWNQYLVMLFCENLKKRVNETNLDPLYSDPRVMSLLKKIEIEFCLHKDKCNILTSADVDNASQNFPPCMLNLHRSLRTKHRLSHSQRFYYSLFLKDIGMSIEEAVKFWRAEYRLHPNGHHTCSHNWEKDEKKYLYGIRHMYGLEGCKKNYTSVNCQHIQSIDNTCSEGGCPFQSFDNSKMIPLLNNCTELLLSKIYELKNKHLYTTACMLYMQNKHLKTNNCDSGVRFNFTPVKYYNMTITKLTNEL